ncbi:hypothetical protein FQN50_009270 [Emmonsiellopsis sp. PD_5]|nr:hypothetical protein FQN50_009270 [Emmonsiellopsis sp. PD_5]
MGSCVSAVAEGSGASRRRGRLGFISPSTTSTRKFFKRRNQKTLEKAEKLFRKSSPTFDDTSHLDQLRTLEYSTLDREGHVYLDYTGGGLYSESQLRAHFDLLRQNIFGNPHSSNPTSSAITELDEQARALVLSFFRASPDEYSVIFTANSSAALKLVGESYPFGPASEAVFLWDNHNSVHGIREFARSKGATITHVPVKFPELRADESAIEAALQRKEGAGNSPRLFAYPAQSNFSGTQHPLEWIEKAQAQGWDVLLDAASFAPTNRLDLSKYHPDFVPISFYKMFGYPSGVGCLLARKEALAKLNRPWFAGGTVWGVTVQADAHVLLDGHEAFEDGTINYLSLPAVHIGLTHLTGIGMESIHERVMCLTDWLVKALLPLRHSDGSPLIRLYGPASTHRRGGTIAFNFLDTKGHVVDERIVENRATARRISLRTGCFCNPGAGEAAFHLSKQILTSAFDGEADMENEKGEKKGWDDFLNDMGMPSGGAIRISLGLMSNFSDVYRFLDFACTFLNDIPVEEKLIPRLHC